MVKKKEFLGSDLEQFLSYMVKWKGKRQKSMYSVVSTELKDMDTQKLAYTYNACDSNRLNFLLDIFFTKHSIIWELELNVVKNNKVSSKTRKFFVMV